MGRTVRSLLLLLTAGYISATAASVVGDCYYQEGSFFKPWKATDLGTTECAWKPMGSTGPNSQKAGTCEAKSICLENMGESQALNNTNQFKCTEGLQCCYIKKDACKGNSLLGAQHGQRSGACLLPRYCSNAASVDANSNCPINSYRQQTTCCVEQAPQSMGVQCSSRYTTAYQRLDKILNEQDDIAPERIINFLPYIMPSFDRLREKCVPRGDCQAATFFAMSYFLLREFTTTRPDIVYQRVLDAVPQATQARLYSQIFNRPDVGGHLTPEAFGSFVDLLWNDADLNLQQYNSGSCADWIRVGTQVVGANYAWDCNERWAKITSYFLCRATFETNLGDCASGEGACYLFSGSNPASSTSCPSGRMLQSGGSECRLYHKNAVCCKKQKTATTRMTFEANEYRNVRVAIDTNVTNNPALLDQIKASFTKASGLLYKATENRALFRSVRIILPRTWDPKLANEVRTDEKLNNAEYFVKPNIHVEDDSPPVRATMNTVQVGFCGAQGFGTTMTLQDFESQLFVPNIVKHFAFNHFGIFREFPRNEIEMNPNKALLDQRIPRCVQDSNTAYVYCDEDLQLHWSAQAKDSNVTASLAWLPDWAPPNFDPSQVVHFCDGRGCDATRSHNIEMDNTHNRVCNRHATFDVMLSHKDFNGRGTPPRPGLDTTPEFIIVHEGYEPEPPTAAPGTTPGSVTPPDSPVTTWKPYEPTPNYIVMVLDQSGSMVDQPIANLKAAASQFIDLTDPTIYLAVVTFDNVAYKMSDFERCDAVGKAKLIRAIEGIEPSGFTCIQSGLNMATDLLKATGKLGGQILLMTDGQNNRCGPHGEIFTDNFYDDSIDAILAQRVVVHTVAITDEADKQLEHMADTTGGKSFLISNADSIYSFLVSFQSALIELTQDDTIKRAVLSTTNTEMKPGSEVEMPILLDSGLSNDNLISAFYDPSLAPVTGVLVSPNGNNGPSVQCSVSNSLNKVSCPMDFKPEPGNWRLRLRSKAAYSSKHQPVTITAASIVDTTMQQTFTIEGKMYTTKISVGEPANDAAWWWKRPQQNVQVIVVSVSYGNMAVLGADVEAVIESAQAFETEDATGYYYHRWTVPLQDDGRSYENYAADGVDLYKNDGIYSGVFNLDNDALFAGRYGITVRARGDSNRAFYTKRVLLGFPKSDNFLARFKHEWNYIAFNRELQIGTFEVRDARFDEDSEPIFNNRRVKRSANVRPPIEKSMLYGTIGVGTSRRETEREPRRAVAPLKRSSRSEDGLTQQLPPGRCTEFRLASSEPTKDNVTFTFTWIAVARNGISIDSGKPTYYALNATSNPLDAWGRGDEIEVASKIDGRRVDSFNLPSRPQDVAGRARTGTITLDKQYWPAGSKVHFSVVAFAIDPETSLLTWSEPSNMVVAAVPDVERETCQANAATGKCLQEPSRHETVKYRRAADAHVHSHDHSDHHFHF